MLSISRQNVAASMCGNVFLCIIVLYMFSLCVFRKLTIVQREAAMCLQASLFVHRNSTIYGDNLQVNASIYSLRVIYIYASRLHYSSIVDTNLFQGNYLPG